MAMDVVWFYWPVTFAIAAGIAVGRLVRLGSGGYAGQSATVPLSVMAIASAALPVVPLWLGISVSCDDGTQFLDFNGVYLGAGVVGIIVWLFILSRLYNSAGEEPYRVERNTLTMFGGLVIGMALEFLASTVSIEGLCSDSNSFMFGQLGTGVVLALTAAFATSRTTSKRAEVG